ncbi:MAG: hypothetical protein KAS19_02535, partial [Anaerolineales bacterium]|nr:hypothetical protein [Anaerolineales bacterium]
IRTAKSGNGTRFQKTLKLHVLPSRRVLRRLATPGSIQRDNPDRHSWMIYSAFEVIRDTGPRGFR